MVHAAFALIGGLVGGVIGAMVAARLMRLDRLWTPRGGVPVGEIADRLRAAARGGSGNVRVVDAGHPVLLRGLAMVAAGRNAAEIRRELLAQSVGIARRDRVWRSVGRALGFAAPICGLAFMAGALFWALGALEEPGGMTRNGVIGLVMLVVAAPMMHALAWRFPKIEMECTARRELLATAIAEGVVAIGAGEGEGEVLGRFDEVLGREGGGIAQPRAA
ncbi:MAG: hypothetical protein ACK5RX_06570 [bacterium]